MYDPNAIVEVTYDLETGDIHAILIEMPSNEPAQSLPAAGEGVANVSADPNRTSLLESTVCPGIDGQMDSWRIDPETETLVPTGVL
jgi:hypothetical protein